MTLLVVAVVIVVGILLAAGCGAIVVFALRGAGAARGSGSVAGGGVLRPVPGAARSFDVDLGGAQGLVSIGRFVPATVSDAAGAYGLGAPGTVHVKARLGPAWPPITVLGRGAGPGAPGIVVLPTGDPAFDARHVVLTTSADPRPVLAVVNPQVRALMLSGAVTRWQMGDLSWLEVTYRTHAEQQACVDGAIRLVTTAVVTSGIPVPPPPGHGGGTQMPTWGT